jgi:hypothetical protein
MQHPFLFPSNSTSTEEYKLKEHYFVVDSRDRDRSKWPNPSEFEVKMEPENTYTGATLSHHYRNVKSIELISACYPSNSSNESCLYLNIPELEGDIMDGTNITSTKAFARLIPSLITNNFIYGDLNNVPKLTYHAQGKRLDKLTIQLKTVDGSIVNFGTDTSPPTAPTDTLQVNLLFKVTTVEPLIH